MTEQHAFTCEPFHNLVQHNIITEDGVSFGFHRDPAEADLDFFASRRSLVSAGDGSYRTRWGASGWSTCIAT